MNSNGFARDRRLGRRLRRQHYAEADISRSEHLPAAPMHTPVHGHAAAHIHKKEAERAVEHMREQLMRQQAEFENYRKRQRRDEQQRIEQANQDLLKNLLPVLDNFDRAVQNSGDSIEAFSAGIDMVRKQLFDILSQNGLEKIEALGQPFDPNRHEAVSMETTDAQPDNTVCGVFQEGYLLKGRLLRPAMVRVAHGA
ncbi:MAG: nucleotide exchange factor GrpE [bacterium]|nr:nucleotide exchange factor GrpE [bacterium]